MSTSTETDFLTSTGNQGEERIDAIKLWLAGTSATGEPTEQDSQADLVLSLKAACNHIISDLFDQAASIIDSEASLDYSLLRIVDGLNAFNPPGDP